MKTATITFKAKLDKELGLIKLPVLTRNHCDMNAFRTHPKHGSYANSDLFPAMLARIKSEVFGQGKLFLRLDSIPENVSVDTSGFLAVVTITI